MPNSPDDNMQKIWDLIDDEYKARDTETQYSSITVSMFVADLKSPFANFPFLRGKAAEKRHLIPIMCQIYKKYLRPGNDEDKHVFLILKNMSSFYECRLPDKQVLPDEIVLKLRGHIDKVLYHYSKVSADATAEKKILWNLVPKFHAMWHIGYQAQYQNPRLAWAYGGEDFVGKMQIIGQAARHGLAAHKRSLSMTVNYILGMTLMLKVPISFS